jgi:hypothetical protein
MRISYSYCTSQWPRAAPQSCSVTQDTIGDPGHHWWPRTPSETHYPQGEKRHQNIIPEIKCIDSEITNITSTLKSLVRISHMTSSNPKGQKLQSSFVRLKSHLELFSKLCWWLTTNMTIVYFALRKWRSAPPSGVL